MLSNPISATEILFSNLGNLSEFDENKCSEVRKYQYHYLSFDTMLFENKDLTPHQLYQLKKGLAEVYILGGRLTGKSLIGLIVDCLLALFHKTFYKGSVSSADAEKIKKVMEQIFVALEYHPIFKLLNINVKRNPYQALTPDGVLLQSVNNNVAGKNPGGNWHGRHDDKNWEEEASYLTNTITHEKLMAQAESGCIQHYTGMTTFTKESPMGKIYYDLKNSSKVINYPSYVNPTWNNEKEEAAVREFGGKSSSGYQVQIDGQVIANGESVYIIEKIRETYIRDKNGMPLPIKTFEINVNNYFRFKDIVIIDRPKNSESIHIHMDIGEGGAPTEIIVLSKIEGVYKYIYNITTFKIAPDENEQVVRYLIDTLQANVVGIDITSGGGKSLLCNLAKDYNKVNETTGLVDEHIFGVSFNEKIPIGFVKDAKGNDTEEHREEYIVDWSIQRLKHIFYNKKIQCLVDLKLDAQMDGIIVTKSGQRTVYGSKIANHLHQAFQVFAICDWNTEFKNIKKIQRKKPGFGSCGE
ncbi:MAG: hypothetical protein WC055_15255, partial [Melioribacteraceae bacterium]